MRKDPVSRKPDADGQKPANQMWGGRFTTSPSAVMAAINDSVSVDQRLAQHDIAGSKAHASMLARQGVIAAADAAAIIDGLEKIAQEISSGKFEFKIELEDVHMNIESRLAELIGEPARRLHTARSRNDQVATDFRLWVRSALAQLDAEVKELQGALIERAEQHVETIMPGFTHLQPAQPVTFGHYLLAYVEMLGRDRSRVADTRRRMNECPLGAAALAGTSFPIDRELTAGLLDFDRPMANSLDAVSDRDFALDYLATAAILAMHLSRMAEEIVIWSTPQFGFIRLSDAYTTGSSIMPQKRNPDAAELVRGKSSRVTGAMMGLLNVMKGLPLAYSKDMQEDKEPVFQTADTLTLCLSAMAGMMRDLQPDVARMRAATEEGFITATDLADWLVRELNMPFRDAHHVTGQIVRLAEDKSCRLDQLALKDMRLIEPKITQAVFDVLTPQASVASRRSFGGTAPQRVREALMQARGRYLS